MEPQTQSTAAELFVPLPILMSSVVLRALTAPFYRNPQRNNRALLYFAFIQVPVFLALWTRCYRSATLRPFSVSFSLSDFTDTEPLSRGASLGRCPPRAEDGNPGMKSPLPAGRGDLCSPLWPTPCSCCSSARDVRRNGNTGTETQRGLGAQAASRWTQSASSFRAGLSK